MGAGEAVHPRVDVTADRLLEAAGVAILDCQCGLRQTHGVAYQNGGACLGCGRKHQPPPGWSPPTIDASLPHLRGSKPVGLIAPPDKRAVPVAGLGEVTVEALSPTCRFCGARLTETGLGVFCPNGHTLRPTPAQWPWSAASKEPGGDTIMRRMRTVTPEETSQVTERPAPAFDPEKDAPFDEPLKTAPGALPMGIQHIDSVQVVRQTVQEPKKQVGAAEAPGAGVMIESLRLSAKELFSPKQFHTFDSSAEVVVAAIFGETVKETYKRASDALADVMREERLRHAREYMAFLNSTEYLELIKAGQHTSYKGK